MSILGLQSANSANAGMPFEIGRVCEPPLVGWTHGRLIAGKRAFDLIVTLAAMPVWLPVLVALIAAVKISDPRSPVLFQHWRTGYRGQRFRVFKIRTMVPNAEQLVKAIMAQNEAGGPQFKMRNDPRVTRFGRILRKSYLDELPQLFNVLKGDMSLVGPRPASTPADAYSDWWKSRLMAVPGLTCSWQINRDIHDDFDGRARLDIDYMRRRSAAQDISLLIRTVAVAFFKRAGI